MSWTDKASAPNCDECGKFISFADLASGAASHRMVTPSSDISYESWETLCREHRAEPPK